MSVVGGGVTGVKANAVCWGGIVIEPQGLPNEPKYAGFMSYTRLDDEHESNRITQLRRQLQQEVCMQLGVRDFVIFQDTEGILVGQQWQNRLERSIDGSSILLAIVTPGFLASAGCRSEVNRFLKRERSAGRNDLIIPVLYIATPGLKAAEDPIAVELSRRQLFPWRSLRFADYDSGEMRAAIAALAENIIETLTRDEPLTFTALGVADPVPSGDDGGDDEPGWLEIFGAAESAMDRLQISLASIGEVIQEIGEIVTDATSALRSNSGGPKSASAGLVVAKRLAKDLNPPADNLVMLANDYLDDLTKLGAGIDLQIRRMAEDGVEHAEQDAGFYWSLVDLDATSSEAFGSISEFRDAVVSQYAVDRTLRTVFRKIVSALEIVISTSASFRRWPADYLRVLVEQGADPGKYRPDGMAGA